MRRNLRLLIAMLGIAAVSTGCTVAEVIHAETTPLDVASLQVSEALLLDVGVLHFQAGIPEKNDVEETRIYPEIREAEARYMPYHIKTTLQGTGFWGAVRVIPSPDVSTDVLVSGVIEASDGEFLTLRLRADDATGQFWFERTYEMQTGASSYAEYRDRTQDPYQKVFNDFANDLHEHALTLEPGEIRRIRQVSEMRFFADMAPTAFDGYMTENRDGIIELNRLPAENDPIVDRLRQIRERDRLVVDTLNEHYANFYYGIAIPYEGWRKRSREQSVAFRMTRQHALRRALIGAAVMVGSAAIDVNSSNYNRRVAQYMARATAWNKGVNTVWDAVRDYRVANVHREEIKELSESFVAEAAPMVVQVQGETMRLTGTAEAQYESWRKLLKEIYQAETGFSQSIQVGDPAREPQPSG